jgi:hypothetical protein
MSDDDLRSQLQAWVRSIDDPIPIEDVQALATSAAPRLLRVAVAAAAAVVLVVGVVTVVGGDGSSDEVVTANDESPGASTAPASTTSPSAGTDDSCDGLRSELRWTASRRTELTAAAGTSASLVEVVTNEGSETCPLPDHRCRVATLLDGAGDPVPRLPTGCGLPGGGREELEPGATREFGVPPVRLPLPPGRYVVEMEQLDGTIGRLSVRLDGRIPACASDSMSLRTDHGPYGAYGKAGRTAEYGLVIKMSEEDCTARVREVRLTVRPSGAPAAPPEVLTDPGDRWYANGSESLVTAISVFGPLDLELGLYDGTITVELHDGTELSSPAALRVA